MGRRKVLAGKESGINIEVLGDHHGGGGGSSTAVNEREAMKLLSRFNFGSKDGTIELISFLVVKNGGYSCFRY